MRIRKILNPGEGITDNVHINVTKDKLVIAVQGANKEPNILNIELDRLKKETNWSDSSLWSIIPETDQGKYRVFNTDAFIYASRNDSTRNLLTIKRYINLSVPFAESNFLDMGLDIIVDSNDISVTSDDIEVVMYIKDGHITSDGLMPQLKVDGSDTVGPEEEQEYKVTVFFNKLNKFNPPIKPFYVYVDSSAGYIPNRVILVDTEGNFRIKAMGLKSGEEIKLKIGFKFHPSRVTKIITVS